LQSTFARCIGERLDSAVIHPATAIERDLRHAGGLCLFGDRLADLLGKDQISAVLGVAADFLLHAGRRSQCTPGHVVDDLSVNVLVGAENAEPRTFGRTEKSVVPRAPLAPLKPNLFELVLVCHKRGTGIAARPPSTYLAAPAPAKALPGLILTTSPRYR